MSSLIILTFITIILCGCVCLISITVFSLIIVDLFTNRTKQEERITLILTANIFIFIFIYALLTVINCINTVLGEFYGYNFESSWCIFSGYLIAVIVAALFHSFVVQVNINYYQSNKKSCVFFFMIFLEFFSIMSNCLFILHMASIILVLYHCSTYSINYRFCSSVSRACLA